MVLLALALIGVGVWNLLTGMTLVGWVCIGMALLLTYVTVEKYWAGD
jgi:hypothetical protein